MEFDENDTCKKKSEIKTKDDIEEMIGLININASNLTQISQVLFSKKSLNAFTNSNIKMVELDSHLLDSLKVGDSITFRGDGDEPLVLCSNSRTYEVKEAETSNTCLVIPDLKSKKETILENINNILIEEKEITGVFNTYFEVRECSPRLNKILEILEPSSFKGLEYERSIEKSNLYNWDRLTSEIQASDGEISASLADYLIACIDGYYRLIAFEFEARAVPFMLDLIEENSWQLDEVDKEISYDSLKEIIPKPVFELLFNKYTEISEKKKEDGTPLYRYHIPKSAQLLAKILLTACPKNNYNDFMEAWKIGCPESMELKEEYLYGSAIVIWNDQLKRKEVIAFPESNLPDNIHKRLDKLFEMKSKWRVPEIAPYILKFTSRTQDVNALLTKYARASTMGDEKYYSSKHGK